MISIVCVYNNREILTDYLLKGLGRQTTKFELLLVDNSGNRFKSASTALTSGGKMATSKYVMFVHQDILLQSDTWLGDAEALLDSIEDLCVAGIAGMRDRRTKMSNMTQGNPPMLVGNFRVQEPVKVQTLDECLLIIPKKLFGELVFDESLCDTWHLYAVDYCLSAKRRGLDSFVLPLPAHHRSAGYSMSNDYYRCLGGIFRKHGAVFPWICTTVGNYYTALPTVTYRILDRIRAVVRAGVFSK